MSFGFKLISLVCFFVIHVLLCYYKIANENNDISNLEKEDYSIQQYNKQYMTQTKTNIDILIQLLGVACIFEYKFLLIGILSGSVMTYFQYMTYVKYHDVFNIFDITYVFIIICFCLAYY